MENAKLNNFNIFNLQSSIFNSQKGFTLLEVMVAIVILGLGLTVVFELFSGGLKSVEISNDYSNDVILANKKMGELSLKEKLDVGKETGDFSEEDNYKWEVDIVSYQVDEETNKEIASPEPALSEKTRFFADAQNDRSEGAQNYDEESENEKYAGIYQYLTVFGSGTINMNTAPELLLRVVKGDEDAKNIILKRQENNGVYDETQKSYMFAIESTGIISVVSGEEIETQNTESGFNKRTIKVI